MLQKYIENTSTIGSSGAVAILKKTCQDAPIRVLTHSNTVAMPTAHSVVHQLHELQKLDHIYSIGTLLYSEFLIGHELMHGDFPSSLVPESSVPNLFKTGNITAVIVGADLVAANSDTVSGVGTYALALAAKEHGVPFYVTAPLASIDMRIPKGDCIRSEDRLGRELVLLGNQWVSTSAQDCCQPHFDVIPAPLITAIITERGAFKSRRLKQEMKRLNDDTFS